MIKNIYFTHLLNWRKNYWQLRNKCDNSIAYSNHLKHLFHRRDSATESLICMWEFIKESGMIKNIFLTHLLDWKKRLLRTAKLMLQFNGMFKSSKTFIPSTWHCNREFNLQENVYSLDVRIHHRIWDDQKHLLHTLVKLKEKTIWELQNQCGRSLACLHSLKHLFNRR